MVEPEDAAQCPEGIAACGRSRARRSRDVWQPYLVGERGPELFVPGQTGRVETNSTLRKLTADGAAAVAGSSSTSTTTGPVTFSPTFNITGGDPHEVAGQVRAEMTRSLAQFEAEQRGLLSD